MRKHLLTLLATLCVALSCANAVQPPATLDTNNESCGQCRMTVSDRHFASQIATPGEEPLFFDDLGCLAKYLQRKPARPEGMAVYVADHQSGEWIPAAQAVFSRCPAVETPMGSHLLAHRDAAAKSRDKAAADCAGVSAKELFGDLGAAGHE